MNLLFAGDAELAPAAAEVVSAELLAPAAVVFPRSAPDVERKPAGKENTSSVHFGKVQDQLQIPAGEQVEGG